MEKKSSNIGLVYGLLAGLSLIVFLLIMYLTGIDSFLSPAAWLGYVIIITFAVLAGLKQRKENGGFLEFSQALKVTFSVFAIGFLLQTIFSYILLNFIDVSFREALTQRTMEKTEEMLRKFGASEDTIEQTIASANSTNSYSIGNQLLGYGIMCIVFFIIALIISAIIKRNRPAFDNSFNTPV